MPQFSSDGNLITFGSNKSGDWEIWGINSDGEQLHRMTFSGGYFGKFDNQSQTLFFSKYNDKGVWRRQLLLGQSEQIIKAQATNHYPWWDLESQRVYLEHSSDKQSGIYQYSTNGELIKLVHKMDNLEPTRFDIDQSIELLLQNQYEEVDGDIWLYQ